MADSLEEALRRVSQLEAENADLQGRILSLHKEIEGLRRANFDYQLQFENRPQEDIWNLTKDISILREENVRLNELTAGLIADINKATKDRESVRKNRPQWLQTDHPLEPKFGFVLMPYRPNWFSEVYTAVFRAFRANGFECDTAKDMLGSDIKCDIWTGICRARVIVADLTENNANVTYEIGIAHHLGKDVILIAQTTEVVFDFKTDRLLIYDPVDLASLTANLGVRIAAILK